MAKQKRFEQETVKPIELTGTAQSLVLPYALAIVFVSENHIGF